MFQEKDRNGEESRDRSPIRSDSSPQIIEVNPPPPRQDEGPLIANHQDGGTTPLLSSTRPPSALADSSSSSVPSAMGGLPPSSQQRPTAAAFRVQEGPRSDSTPFTPPLATSGISGTPSASHRPPSHNSDLNGSKSRDDEICIVGEKEGNRSLSSAGGGGRTSAQSEHSISRLHNGSLESPGSSSGPSLLHHHNNHHRNSSPAVVGGGKASPAANNGPAKSDSPSIVKHIPPPAQQQHPHGLSPSSSSYYGRSPHLGPDPYSRVAAGLPPSSYPLTSHHYAAPTAGLADPRSLAMLPHHAMLSASGLGRPPFDYAGLDPFRDPYLMARDPLREAREREFLRLNPLSSLMNSELERAKAMSSFGYPPGLSAAGYPGYPATTMAAHKMPPHPHHLSGLYAHSAMHSAAGAVPPSMGVLSAAHHHPGLSAAAAHHLGLNGVPGSAAAAAAAVPYGKDPLRR